MTKSVTVELTIGQAIPNAGESESNWIIAVWEEAQEAIQKKPFRVEDPYRAELDDYLVTLDASDIINRLKEARDQGKGFAKYLQAAHLEDLGTSGSMKITVESNGSPLEKFTLYHAVGVFVQQLVLAISISMPGACHLQESAYAGSNRKELEAPGFDSTMFTNGWLSAFEADWPSLKPLKFNDVWEWLKACGISETDTALKPVNKVLFGLLEVGQQMEPFGARDILMVSHMLEMLMSMDEAENPHLLRDRIASVLGAPSAKAGTFTELYRVKNAMIRGEHPVSRPAIVIHDADEEILRQLEQHNSPMEQALAIVLSLLQDLVRQGAMGYRFTEQVSRIH